MYYTCSYTVNSLSEFTEKLHVEYGIPVVTQTVFLEQSFGKGDLNIKDGRQKVGDVFTKETGEKFDPDRNTRTEKSWDSSFGCK